MSFSHTTIELPSVGRVVHYRAYGTPGGEYPAGVCRAAVVTQVKTPDEPFSEVGLAILNPTGFFFNASVPYGDQPGGWHWPEKVGPKELEVPPPGGEAEKPRAHSSG